MAPVTLYDSSIALFIRGQNLLLELLKKAAESPDAATLPEARLADDM